MQVAVPASYYLVREDRDDERFAWRMFSVVRLTRCEVDGYDQRADAVPVEIELPHALHASWIRSLERGRKRVIERFLASRCAQPGVRASRLERRCRTPAGSALPLMTYDHRCEGAR